MASGLSTSLRVSRRDRVGTLGLWNTRYDETFVVLMYIVSLFGWRATLPILGFIDLVFVFYCFRVFVFLYSCCIFVEIQRDLF